MVILLSLYALFALGTICLSLLWLLKCYEHARFFHSHIRKACPPDIFPRVELFVPCKGIDLGFDNMVEGVLDQHYPDYRVTFVVESVDDPAHARLQTWLRRTRPDRASIVIAGRATDCGQKVHNLLQATQNLRRSVQVLAFMDSDIEPDADWLSRLVSRMSRADHAVVTGYRWFVPVAGDWPSTVLSAWNAAVAQYAGNHCGNPIWGGTWAIRRQLFDSARIREAWQGALTDDLTAWQALRRTGQTVAYEPGCLVASPLQTNWKRAVEFGVRQYFITKIYAPKYWWFAVAGGFLFHTAFWGGAALCFATWLIGNPAWWILGCAGGLYAIQSWRAALRHGMVKARFPTQWGRLRRIAFCDILGHPVLSLLHWGLILASALRRQITWRGICYRMKGHQTEIISSGSVPVEPRRAMAG